jgi:class 3 adenylate cyclase
MSQAIDSSPVERGRAALARHEWREAFDLLTQADGRGELSGESLELLAQASWWVGRLPDAIDARERAYAAAVGAGDNRAAAAEAILLARDNSFRMNNSAAGSWLNRATRQLEGQPESAATGWLAAIRALIVGQTNELDQALEYATSAWEIGKRVSDHNLETFALACRGLNLVYLGRVDEGIEALDEAAIVATGGTVDPVTAGGVSCTAISACASLGDWSRAAQWTAAQDRWCSREHINGFPGMCRLYRAEAKRFHGAWLEAEAEARRASDELMGFIPAAVGTALYEIGLIRLRRGDLPAAAEALVRAHALNRDPEPALSLVRLAEGDVRAAAESIRRALEEPPATRAWTAPPASAINRVTLLPAQVEIALAAGDVPLARAAADELAGLGERYKSTAIRADVTLALGAVLAAEGDRAAAAAALRTAIDLWTQVDAPYEAARSRSVLAGVYAADGARDRGLMELQAARTTFERLGAALDLRRADEQLAALTTGDSARPSTSDTERAIRTFVFTDIVDSTKFAELLGDQAWHDLLRWHDGALRSIVAEHRGDEIKTVGDGFFLAFNSSEQAIDAAIAIQRRLASQRQTNGFAPAVRIGIHRAEADRAGLDYIGTGDNTAARVGGQAGGGEILVSASTLQGLRRPLAELGRRIADLKGLAAPVEVVSIDWR